MVKAGVPIEDLSCRGGAGGVTVREPSQSPMIWRKGTGRSAAALTERGRSSLAVRGRSVDWPTEPLATATDQARRRAALQAAAA